MSNASESTKNDTAWQKLFEKYIIMQNIENNGYFEINASQINEFREARLMTKFDHKINLPKLFSNNDLSILPITRGSYIISHFDAYKKLEEFDSVIHRASFPEHIQSIDYENISSEATAINCAYISNILVDFLEDEELLPTVSGRMSSNTFAFNIKNTKTNKDVAIQVANSQIEIDGGYEGLQSLSIVEAKSFISDDFLIRQLYYPYRLWSAKVSKTVKPVFLVYSNGVFNLYEYKFQDPSNYNSLILVKQKNYSIEAVDISLDDILNILFRVRTVKEPKIAFPQADSFRRVINLCELLLENENTRDDITTNYAFDPRQSNYYTDAARYLGLVNKRHENRMPIYSLSDEGRKILALGYKQRQLKFIELILEHGVFQATLKRYLDYSEMPPKTEIINIMKDAHLFNVEADSTYERRASTVTGWINWILDLHM